MNLLSIGDRVDYHGRKATVVCDNLNICACYLLKFDDGARWVGRDNHNVMHRGDLRHLLNETGLWWCHPGSLVLLSSKDEYEIDE